MLANVPKLLARNFTENRSLIQKLSLQHFSFSFQPCQKIVKKEILPPTLDLMEVESAQNQNAAKSLPSPTELKENLKLKHHSECEEKRFQIPPENEVITTSVPTFLQQEELIVSKGSSTERGVASNVTAVNVYSGNETNTSSEFLIESTPTDIKDNLKKAIEISKDKSAIDLIEKKTENTTERESDILRKPSSLTAPSETAAAKNLEQFSENPSRELRLVPVKVAVSNQNTGKVTPTISRQTENLSNVSSVASLSKQAAVSPSKSTQTEDLPTETNQPTTAIPNPRKIKLPKHPSMEEVESDNFLSQPNNGGSTQELGQSKKDQGTQSILHQSVANQAQQILGNYYKDGNNVMYSSPFNGYMSDTSTDYEREDRQILHSSLGTTNISLDRNTPLFQDSVVNSSTVIDDADEELEILTDNTSQTCSQGSDPNYSDVIDIEESEDELEITASVVSPHRRRRAGGSARRLFDQNLSSGNQQGQLVENTARRSRRRNQRRNETQIQNIEPNRTYTPLHPRSLLHTNNIPIANTSRDINATRSVVGRPPNNLEPPPVTRIPVQNQNLQTLTNTPRRKRNRNGAIQENQNSQLRINNQNIQNMQQDFSNATQNVVNIPQSHMSLNPTDIPPNIGNTPQTMPVMQAQNNPNMNNIFNSPSNSQQASVPNSPSLRYLKDRTCTLCAHTFPNLTLARQHVKSVHLTPVNQHQLKCNFCQALFSNSQELVTHMITHKSPNTRNRNTNQQNVNPQAGHGQQSKSNNVIQAGVNAQEIPSKNGTSTERSTRNTSKGKHSHNCDVCFHSFKHRADLTKHMLIHTQELPHACNICSKRFRQQGHLISHMGSKHRNNNGGSYACPHCLTNYQSEKEFQKHMRQHDAELPHVCNLCQERFKLKSDLLLHLNDHNDGRPYTCHICKKSFKTKTYLYGHMQMHKVPANDSLPLGINSNVNEQSLNNINFQNNCTQVLPSAGVANVKVQPD